MRMNGKNVLLMIFATFCLPCLGGEVIDTKVALSCSISGVYADGTPIKTSGVEEINIEIKRINWNEKEPSKAPAWGSMSNIKIKSNNQTYEGSLLRSTKDQVAFAFSSDTVIDRPPKTMALTYEVTLDKPRLRRTIQTLFSKASNTTQYTEGDCTSR